MMEPVAIYDEHCEPEWQVPQSRTNSHIAVLATEGHAVFEGEGEGLPLLTAPQACVAKLRNYYVRYKMPTDAIPS